VIHVLEKGNDTQLEIERRHQNTGQILQSAHWLVTHIQTHKSARTTEVLVSMVMAIVVVWFILGEEFTSNVVRKLRVIVAYPHWVKFDLLIKCLSVLLDLYIPVPDNLYQELSEHCITAPSKLSAHFPKAFTEKNCKPVLQP
jgi:hypothetical protein